MTIVKFTYQHLSPIGGIMSDFIRFGNYVRFAFGSQVRVVTFGWCRAVSSVIWLDRVRRGRVLVGRFESG
jgi:hypothetical protein